MPKDGEDSAERTVLQEPKVIQETREPTDPLVQEVYKVRLDPEDLLGRKVPKGLKALKVQKARRVLQPEIRAIK